MDNELKEYYVKIVKAYGVHNEAIDNYLSVQTTYISAKAASLITSSRTFSDATGDIYKVGLFRKIVLSTTMMLNALKMTIKINSKIKGNIKVEEIRAFFEYHGLVLEDELENSKGRGK